MNKRALVEADQVDGDDVDDEEESGSEADYDIEIVDDVPPEQKPRTKTDDADDGGDDDDGSEDGDLEGYSEKVQKRLKKLTFKYREAERKEQDAARMRDEAVRYAQQVSEENKQLRQNVEQAQGAYVEQAKARAKAEVEQAKRKFREAYEAGEADDLAEAQEVLSKAQNELYRLENYKPRPVQSSVPERDWNQQPTQPQPTQQQPTPPLTAQQQRWLQNNQWFGKNRAMTSLAYGLHEELIESGVDPNSQTYYDEIDKGMRKRFPDEFEDDADMEEVEVPARRQRQKANVVAGANRSTKQPRKIKLTSTQAALARRLGLTPEQYAAQILKEAKNNG